MECGIRNAELSLFTARRISAQKSDGLTGRRFSLSKKSNNDRFLYTEHRKQTNGTAHLQRLHQSLHRRRTSTLRGIASARRRKIRAILSNGDVHDAAAYRASMVPTGSGGIAFSILPGGFRFLSPRRKEHVTASYCMEMCISPCSVVQSAAGSLSHLR